MSSALANSGYSVLPSYLHPMGFKTNAAMDFIIKIADEWKKKNADKDYQGEVCFERNDAAINLLKNMEPRFLPNPEENWGPKSAAKIKTNLELLNVMKKLKK